MILPEAILDGMVSAIAEKMKYDHETNMICTREPGS